MAMAVENRQQSQMAGIAYDSMRGGYTAAPHFTNPWVSAPNAAPQLYPTSLPQTSSTMSAMDSKPSMPPYSSLPGTAPTGIPLQQGHLQSQNLLDVSQGSYAPSYSSATSPTAAAYAPTSAPQYSADPYRGSPYAYQSDHSRRGSHPSVPSEVLLDPSLEGPRVVPHSTVIDYNNRLSNQSQRSSFSDALDASRGMVAMSQTDLTPRNIYGNGNPRSSHDSYGFPSTPHSSHSSISSASTYPSYYNGSVDGSATDYSSASESVGDMGSRTLPRPSALVGTNLPPAPQSMMGQFSSKVSSSSQKKHKCKICDKRFTRPSSLQTHMYSHTGEKPFMCEVEGCGRHFSVVSNLRRHKKVHKADGRDHPSPDDM
ncbi:hypothetical protein EJ05DRAFT_150878 [Pseudovirgaria hyperparasitica]|uniref:C2H2-type domain-containing protein n=1 Tax=Pseudovirgaria hyperparasitica TaxID=470096 RepID=A0A6A6VWS5_9PEZI|nr:uncharacterized protein EJ05DRAFT_150878 [Pseudovirgaria hyperparasitica]KAF2754164.1 hypothetical protein EJ05DRAFT_150878 [Pseudovirgaria hyperparasitica]